MSTAVLAPQNPAELGYPPTFPVEIALRTAPIADICKAYDITREEWNRLRADPAFIADVTRLTDELKKDGVSFRMKARLQSEELLKTSWRMIHAKDTPPAVAADLLKFTVKAAGLSEEKTALGSQQGTGLSININLG